MGAIQYLQRKLHSKEQVDKKISVTSGGIRGLTDNEKLDYPKYVWVTEDPFTIEYGDKKITVPAGFLTDGATGGPDYGCSWLFHDYLYATHKFDCICEPNTIDCECDRECTRVEADKIMEEILEHERIYWYCWLFVKLCKFNPFWAFSRAWDSSGERGPQYLIDEQI